MTAVTLPTERVLVFGQFQSSTNFGVLRKAFRGVLGIDLPAVNEHLEAAAGRGLKLECADVVFEFFEELLRQTDGMRFVVSGGAVFDFDRHTVSCSTRYGI